MNDTSVDPDWLLPQTDEGDGEAGDGKDGAASHVAEQPAVYRVDTGRGQVMTPVKEAILA